MNFSSISNYFQSQEHVGCNYIKKKFRHPKEMLLKAIFRKSNDIHCLESQKCSFFFFLPCRQTESLSLPDPGAALFISDRSFSIFFFKVTVTYDSIIKVRVDT